MSERAYVMGLRWHLVAYVESHGLAWSEVETKLGFKVGADLRGPVPPVDLSLSVLADLCQALGCQPGELLGWQPDDPAEQAERALANDQFFQSFLAHKQSQE